MVDWESLTALYDNLHAQKALRAPRCSSAPGATKEWSSKWIEYATNQINSDRLRETWQGTTNLNLAASDDHIANVILRQYKHLIHPFKTPFRSSDFVPEAVWQAMKAKVVECREYHVMWVETDRQEMWNRPVHMCWTPEGPAQIELTGYIHIDESIYPSTSMKIVQKGPKKTPVLRITLGVR